MGKANTCPPPPPLPPSFPPSLPPLLLARPFFPNPQQTDKVTRTSERYAEIFRKRMDELRRREPYPDVYYVLFLDNVSRARRVHATYNTLPDNMTITRKGIHNFCAKYVPARTRLPLL